ncbi:hypothetical protein ACVXHA_14170 [Escherichia coli]
MENGRLKVSRGSSRCSGGNYENVIAAANALRGQSVAMTPSRWQFTRHHSRCLWTAAKKVWSRFDRRRRNHQNRVRGPCFGAGDTPINNGLKNSPHHA